MRRSRLLSFGGIGYTVVLALTAALVAMGALGLVLKLAAAMGALPAKLSGLANAMPGLTASVSADPMSQSVAGITLTA